MDARPVAHHAGFPSRAKNQLPCPTPARSVQNRCRTHNSSSAPAAAWLLNSPALTAASNCPHRPTHSPPAPLALTTFGAADLVDAFTTWTAPRATTLTARRERNSGPRDSEQSSFFSTLTNAASQTRSSPAPKVHDRPGWGALPRPRTSAGLTCTPWGCYSQSRNPVWSNCGPNEGRPFILRVRISPRPAFV